METSSTIRLGIEAGTNGAVSQLSHCRPPREGQHSRPSIPALLVAQDDYLDRVICSRVRALSKKQNMHHKEENPPVLHPRRPINVPIQCCGSRSHHSTTEGQWVQCNPYYSGSRMFQSSHFPTMPYDHHWRRSGPIIPQKSVPMVWSSFKGNI